MKEYIKALDGFLQMDGKLEHNFIPDPKFEEFHKSLVPDDPLNFDDLYACLCKWATSTEQTQLDYDDFAAAELPAS